MNINPTMKRCVEFLESDNGVLSSKRLISLLAFVFMTTAFFSNLYGGFKMDEFIFNAMRDLVMVGIGFTAVEKFAPNSAKSDSE